MQYGVGLGDRMTKVGEVFKFMDFDLKFQGYRELSDEQKKLKQESIAKGIDGGNSMLGPSNVFSVIQGTKIIAELELMTLPYSRRKFEIESQKFELRNSPTNETKWLVNVLN